MLPGPTNTAKADVQLARPQIDTAAAAGKPTAETSSARAERTMPLPLSPSLEHWVLGGMDPWIIGWMGVLLIPWQLD